LEWIVSTPGFHHWHHTYGLQRNCNYASILPWIDRLFGSHCLPKVWPSRYGYGSHFGRAARSAVPGATRRRRGRQCNKACNSRRLIANPEARASRQGRLERPNVQYRLSAPSTPGFGKNNCNLSGFSPSQSQESDGGGFFIVMLAQTFANSAFSRYHFYRGSVFGLIASSGHSGTQSIVFNSACSWQQHSSAPLRKHLIWLE
jgi:hypothetical protein